MSAHRFFLTESLPQTGDPVVAPLSDEDLHHALRVLRIRAGELLELVEPGDFGASWRVKVLGADDGGVRVETVERLERITHPQVTLVQGVAKGEKMDAIVRQATELGAAAIIPVITERTVVKLDERKRADRGERWRRIARSAAEQSRRDDIPAVGDPVTLAEFASFAAGYDGVVVLWEDSSGVGLAASLTPWSAEPQARIAIVVGPEGGLSAEEVDVLVEHGAVVASLGSSILRTETAAIVALGLAIHELGGLGHG